MTMAQMEENSAPPATFGHIMSVWGVMTEEAKDTPDGRIWEGYMTKLVLNKLKLAIPYYTATTQALKGMGCAQQLTRGGGSAPSRWLLKKPPTLDEYLLWEQHKEKAPSQVSTSKTAVLQGQMQDHEGRIALLESTVAELLEALQDKNG
jgi:hypothetical protein